jgi:hypothetical protein
VTPKPQRTILARVSAYAEEAAGFLRRRRMTRKPFARVGYPGGRATSYPPQTEAGRALFLAAADLIEAGR